MKKLFIGIDFSKEKLDATIILACGMNEIGSREYGVSQITLRATASYVIGLKQTLGIQLLRNGYSVEKTQVHVV